MKLPNTLPIIITFVSYIVIKYSSDKTNIFANEPVLYIVKML